MASHKSVGRGDAHAPGVIADYAEFTEAAAPGTPASGFVRAYTKTDGKFYIKDDAGLETDITGGGGGSGAMTLISSVTTSGSQSTIAFSSISGAYNHLLLLGMVRTDRAAQTTRIGIQVGNSSLDTGSNYVYYVQQEGNDADVSLSSSDGATAGDLARYTFPAGSATANRFGTLRIWIPEYTNTAFHRNIHSDARVNAHTDTDRYLHGHGITTWTNAADAIDIISLASLEASDDFADGSIVRLYGII